MIRQRRRQTSKILLDGLFDDAAIFPPGNAPMDRAVAGHAEYLRSWYAGSVGPFVCSDARLPELEQVLTARGGGMLDVTVTVPQGPSAVRSALTVAENCRHLRLVGLEVPLNGVAVEPILDWAYRDEQPLTIFAEVPVGELTGGLAAELAGSGLRLKLRTGGMVAGAFPGESELSAALSIIVAARLPFKCTAGLHHAVRHRDPQTGFEHHGFLNILLAVSELGRSGGTEGGIEGGTGGAAERGTETARAILAERDPDLVAAAMLRMTGTQMAAARSLFQSFGTCSIAEPLSDLRALGLVEAP
jgi:hypothetical protein